MKISKIKALCKKEQRVMIYTETGPGGEIVQQYISSGTVIVPIEGLPLLEPSNIPTLFSLNDKALEKMSLQAAPLPENMPVGDLDRDDELLFPLSVRIVAGKATLLPFMTADGGTVFLDEARLGAVQSKIPQFALRYVGEISRVPVVAVMDGIFLAGLVLPTILTDETIKELLIIKMAAEKERGNA